MSNTRSSAALIAAVADLQEETTLSLVRQRLEAGDDPLRVIKDCQEGMRQVDLFRIDDGKVVEHWDNAEPVPPEDEWVNSGKF